MRGCAQLCAGFGGGVEGCDWGGERVGRCFWCQCITNAKNRQQEIRSGKNPDFLPSTAHIRSSDWKVAPVPPVLQDRRVEITGPVDRKMVINALNSGANCFMADFEDSSTYNRYFIPKKESRNYRKAGINWGGWRGSKMIGRPKEREKR